MANSEMPEDFYWELEPLLPKRKPMSSRGGRPPIPHSIVVKVIWFVLTSGCRWEDVPRLVDRGQKRYHFRGQNGATFEVARRVAGRPQWRWVMTSMLQAVGPRQQLEGVEGRVSSSSAFSPDGDRAQM